MFKFLQLEDGRQSGFSDTWMLGLRFPITILFRKQWEGKKQTQKCYSEICYKYANQQKNTWVVVFVISELPCIKSSLHIEWLFVEAFLHFGAPSWPSCVIYVITKIQTIYSETVHDELSSFLPVELCCSPLVILAYVIK